MNKKDDPRYPWTHAADLLRMIPERDGGSCKLDRGDSSDIRRTISKILGLDDRNVAEKLADYFLENQEEMADKTVKQMQAYFKREGYE